LSVSAFIYATVGVAWIGRAVHVGILRTRRARPRRERRYDPESDHEPRRVDAEEVS